MSTNVLSIDIPESLIEKIAEITGDASKEAVEDFVIIVLQNYLENNADELSKVGDNAVEKRLKDLGYL